MKKELKSKEAIELAESAHEALRKFRDAAISLLRDMPQSDPFYDLCFTAMKQHKKIHRMILDGTDDEYVDDLVKVESPKPGEERWGAK